jgi:Membrane bound beta barrel domain (DUF5777)
MNVCEGSTIRAAVAAVVLVFSGGMQASAHAQEAAAAGPPPAQESKPPVSERAVDPAQPDFTLIGLPTTLRIPKYASVFRFTHRFTRSLAAGDFSDLLGDAFGVDGGAQVGLEYRFGLRSGTQIGIHRTSERTIQFFLQQQVLRQGETLPVTVDAIGAIQGTNNFRGRYSPSVGAIVSRTFGRHGAVFAHPIWINNTNPSSSDAVDDNNTFIIGVGGRVRVLSTVYLLAEAAPRFGYEPDSTYVSFAIEKRWGGHSFQVNFSNGIGTTLAQIAGGGLDYDNWFLGFNISRKFF